MQEKHNQLHWKVSQSQQILNSDSFWFANTAGINLQPTPASGKLWYMDVDGTKSF